mmetsp:Transcript_31486/g.37502  ORF Transcript_31486/g.37502 Transcript_31486/m.37502 type:complete len:554 (-) Transcript_31486:112-1773(-)
MSEYERENETPDSRTDGIREPLLGNTIASDGDDGISLRTTDGTSESEQGDDGPTEKDISLRLCGKTYFMNHNVVLNLVLAVLYGISDSIWSGTVFAAYLKTLSGGRNEPVGNVEAVNGLAVLFSALPVGYLADRYGRSIIIKIGGVLIALTAAFHISVLQWIGVDANALRDDSNAFILLGIVMALWGIGGGIVNGPTQALYADSTPAGTRSVYYHYLFVCYMISSCCGPILSIILFQKLGDDWNLQDLRTVCYVGLGMNFFNSFVMMFFDDKKALNEDEVVVVEEQTVSEEQGKQQADDPSPASSTHLEDGGSNISADLPAEIIEAQEDGESTNFVLMQNEEEGEQSVPPEDLTMVTRQKWIPYIMFTSNLIFAIGSGMTVKFFPLFFKDEVGMTPTEVQFIYVLAPIALVLSSGLGTSLSKILGRVQTTLVLYIAGLLCLLSMIIFKNYLDSHPFALVPIYILRTAFMNGSYPLQESILMDFVPKNERARWKSLESVAVFGWCGSAALGGIISDKSDYTHTFLATVIIQSFGLIFFSLLLPLVPRNEADMAR